MNMTPVAQAVQRQGRGEDTMLVHMTPREVGGLQALAMQHGGSLTINPQTGLPEAGFLKNILPTLLGVALTPFMGPLAAGLTVGGVETVRTGDIGKGFLAGLGAYGGANLAGGLTQAATQPAQQAAMANVAAEQATNQAIASGVPVVGSDTGVTGFLPGSEGGVNQIMNAYTQNVPQTIGQQYSAMGKGFTDVLSSGDTGTAARSAFMDKLGGTTGAIKTAGMAGAPMIADALMPKPYKAPAQEKEESNYEGPYTPSPRRVSYPGEEERRRTSEYMYFSPSNPVPFAEGGETAPQSESKVVISPNEARVYQDIIDTQILAGLPALDPEQFIVAPGRNYSQYVYNPIGENRPVAQDTGEKDYGIGALLTKAQIEAEQAAKAAALAKQNAGKLSIIGYDISGNPIYSSDPTSSPNFMNNFMSRMLNPAGNAKGGEISAPKFADGGDVASNSTATPEGQVLQNIIDMQQLAGLDALDLNRFANQNRNYEQYVYNPIQSVGSAPSGSSAPPISGTGEINYGFAPLLSKEQIKTAPVGGLILDEVEFDPRSSHSIGKYRAAPQPSAFTPEQTFRFYTDPNLYGAVGGFASLIEDKRSYGGAKGGVIQDGSFVSTNAAKEKYAKGGSVPQLEDGGFVLTKKAVDGLGKGSNKKGQQVASRGLGAIPIKGPGTGTSDSIKTTIDGKHPALISNGEAYVPKRQVAKKGGAKAFYALMNKAEKAADRRKRA